jgi:hypothetical protein
MNVKRLYLLLIGLTLAGVLLASSCAPSKSPALGGLDEWNLVVIGESVAAGLGEQGTAAALYAAHIGNDMGVRVNVEERTAELMTARQALGALRDPEYGENLTLRRWPDLVSDAEVVVLAVGPEDLTSGTGSWINQCAVPVPLVDCSTETLEAFAADLDAIYEEILRLRNGSPTIVRTLEYFAPHLTSWREGGVEDECTRCYEKMNAVIRQTAEEHGVPVAPMYEIMNGPNHDQDPREAGYVIPNSVRLTKAGLQAIADQLRDLGYEPVNQ